MLNIVDNGKLTFLVVFEQTFRTTDIEVELSLGSQISMRLRFREIECFPGNTNY
jgi:hypothetical protein